MSITDVLNAIEVFGLRSFKGFDAIRRYGDEQYRNGYREGVSNTIYDENQ